MKEEKKNWHEIALVYLNSATKKEMAEKLGVGYSTVKQWCQKKEFLDALNEVRTTAFEKAMQKVSIYASDAVTELHRMGMSEDTPATAKVSALRALIDASFGAFEISEIEPLLRQIRERQE